MAAAGLLWLPFAGAARRRAWWGSRGSVWLRAFAVLAFVMGLAGCRTISYPYSTPQSEKTYNIVIQSTAMGVSGVEQMPVTLIVGK